MTEIGQGTFDPAIAPARVLCGEADDEFLDLFHDTRPTWSAPRPMIPLGSDQLAMPGEDRVGGDDPGQIQECLSADSLAGDGQPDPSVSELFEKDAVLFPKKVNRRLLMTIDPACERREEDLPGLKGVGHEPILAMCGRMQQLPKRSGRQ